MGAWWHELWVGLRDDFSDLPDGAQAVRIVVRLALAALLGGLLGFQREQSGKSAGLRTHMLVALGAALFALIPSQAEMGLEDMSRVMQGIIAGVGFLCAGTILKQNEQGIIRGLTTAASIWLTAAIGMGVGIGRLASAVVSTLIALLILSLIPHFGKNGTNGDSDHGHSVPPQGGREAPPETHGPMPADKAHFPSGMGGSSL